MSDWEKRREEWDLRYRMFGRRSVFHIGHGEQELMDITLKQRETILPLLRSSLNGREFLALDFGCGWGRWTETLANEILGQAIGVDPTPGLLAEAMSLRASPRVEFGLLNDGKIPLDDRSVDLFWACLVFSTILDETILATTMSEVQRVLAPGALVFIVDNTEGRGGRPVRSRWSISRTVEEYRALFSEIVDLEVLGSYEDLGEINTIMSGRAS